jgi:CHASE2 domain-containing sensor protein
VTLAELRTDLVILTCAISAGIHGALVPDHFEEGMGAGLGFVVATVLLAVLAAVLTRKPTQLALLATAAVFAGLIASYALAITTGLPVLHPEPEAVDGLALFTKAVESVGLVVAGSLLRRPSLAITLTQPKGTLT